MNIMSHLCGKVSALFLHIHSRNMFSAASLFSISQFPMSGKESAVDSRINHVVLEHILSSSLCLAAAAGQPCCFTRTGQTKQRLYLWTGCSLVALSSMSF